MVIEQGVRKAVTLSKAGCWLPRNTGPLPQNKNAFGGVEVAASSFALEGIMDPAGCSLRAGEVLNARKLNLKKLPCQLFLPFISKCSVTTPHYQLQSEHINACSCQQEIRLWKGEENAWEVNGPQMLIVPFSGCRREYMLAVGL